MEDFSRGNQEIDRRSLFEALNHYYLLFFSFSCIVASIFLQQIFVAMDQFRLGIAIAPVVGILLPVFILARRFHPGVRRQLSIARPRPIPSILVTVATIIMVAIVDNVYVISQHFLPTPHYYLEGLKELKPTGLGSAALTFVGLCLVVPAAEEIVFRGIVQRVFQRNMTPFVSIVLAGVFFGVIHLSPQLLLSMTCFGVFLGFVFHTTSNLTYTILSHGVLNAVAFVQLTFETDEDMATAPFYVQDWWYLPLAVVLVVILSREIKRGATPPPAAAPLDASDDFE